MFFAWLSRRPGHKVVVGAAAKYVVTSSNYTPTAGSGVTITAQLTDANNHSVKTAGLVVTWSKSDPGGSFGSPTSTTDANGVATVVFTKSATPSTSTTVTATDGGALTGTSATIATQAGAGTSPNYFGSVYFPSADFAGAYFP